VLFLRGRKRIKLWRGIAITAVCAAVWWSGERTAGRVNDWRTETLPLAQSLIKTHPAAQYHYRLGMALAQLKMTTNSVAQLEIAQRIDPAMASVVTPLAILLSKAESTEDTVNRLRQALESEPTNVTVQVQLARVLIGRKQIPDALPYLMAAATAPSPDAWACQKLAWILATSTNDAIRNGTAALKWAKLAETLAGSDDVDAVDALAAAHAEIGNFDDACRSAAKAADLANRHGLGAKAKAIRVRYGTYTRHLPYRESD
jgi:tetratricopeptide (TPR) repeat protein